MPSKTEIQRRKALKREVIGRERDVAQARMPISKPHLAELFDYLDLALVAGCDHSFRFTLAFLQSKALSHASIVPWLGEYGGFCDCEVLANVENDWGQA